MSQIGISKFMYIIIQFALLVYNFDSKNSTIMTSNIKVKKAFEINNLDSIKIDHLSCRARTVTNVGLDQLVNTYFKTGKRSFYRYELQRPEMLWGEHDYDFWEIPCSESCDKKIRELDLSGVKCLSCENVVTKGTAKYFFTVLYPLVGKTFQEDFEAMFAKLKPKNTQEEVSKNFANLPFEKEQWKSQSKNKAGTLPKRTVAYLLIRNMWTGFEKSLMQLNKLQRVLRCSGHKKQINSEDIQTTLINNKIVELKVPALWINELVINTTHNDNMGFNQQKLWYAVALGQLEQFSTSEGDMFGTDVILEEWNEQCKDVREYMLHLWSESRDIKCGDAGYVPNPNAEDPLATKD